MISEVISHYRVLDTVGGGGMGFVYKAEDLKPKRLVALPGTDTVAERTTLLPTVRPSDPRSAKGGPVIGRGFGFL
jgi:hypothetical protein